MSAPERIDMARDSHVPTVSRVPEIDPTTTTVVSAVPAFSEAEIAALVARRFRRYSQAIV
jgi:hypothetical protein